MSNKCTVAYVRTCSLSSCTSPPLNPDHAQNSKYKHLNCSNTAGHHGQHTYLIQTQHPVSVPRAGIYYNWWVCIAHAKNSLYHFRMVVTHATFGLLAVAAFLVSSNMSTADWIRGKTVIVVKGDDPFSRLHI